MTTSAGHEVVKRKHFALLIHVKNRRIIAEAKLHDARVIGRYQVKEINADSIDEIREVIAQVEEFIQIMEEEE